MAGTDYSSWSMSRLKKEQDKIEKAISDKEGEEREKAIAAIKQTAENSGFELSELLGGLGGGGSRAKRGGSSRKNGKVAPKYRNPADRNDTWSGRGRKPKWVEAHLEKHGNLDAVTI